MLGRGYQSSDRGQLRRVTVRSEEVRERSIRGVSRGQLERGKQLLVGGQPRSGRGQPRRVTVKSDEVRERSVIER